MDWGASRRSEAGKDREREPFYAGAWTEGPRRGGRPNPNPATERGGAVKSIARS